jgi:hypothetical protein
MWQTVGTAGFVGIEILLALALGYLGGQWLDGKLHTAPWLKRVGTVMGLGTSIWVLVTVVRNYNASLKDDDGSPPKN